MRSLLRFSSFLCLVVFLCSTAVAADPSEGVRINNLKVLSDKIDDVTTVENILKSFCKPGMSDAERSKAIWTAIVKYRHQTTPPNELLAADWEAHDPVKIFNTYGYCMCCCCSSLIESLNRVDGREARGRILTGHSVPEVFYDGSWHMYDASLITFFPKPGKGGVASVDEITEAITGWYAKNPGFKGNNAKLDETMRSDGWTGFKKGPELLADCPFYKLGWFPARTHGWNNTMVEYDRKCEVYEYGYQIGHRALFSLRPGETLIREAGNRGLHVNNDPNWDGLKAKGTENDLVYLKEFFPQYNGSLVANGTHRYTPDLAASGLEHGAEVYENLATGTAPALHPKASGKPGVVVIPMTSPYIYLGGQLKLGWTRKVENDQIAVSISTNNGRTFEPVWKATEIGTKETTVNLSPKIERRYAYWVKIEINAASPESAGINGLTLLNDIQHAPRTLPWLGAGSNTITVAADSDTTLATRTISCRITPDTKFNKNETSSTMGLTFDKLKVDDGSCWWQGGTGSMTVPIETPGDQVALRFGGHMRARGEKDIVRMQASFDDGKTWKEIAKFTGPTQGRTAYYRFDQVPPGTKKTLLRYEMTGNNTVGILSFRVDAEYKDPLAAKAVRPFEVVHRWKENGQEKTNRARVDKLPFTYKIDAAGTPEMVSVTYEMPAK